MNSASGPYCRESPLLMTYLLILLLDFFLFLIIILQNPMVILQKYSSSRCEPCWDIYSYAACYISHAENYRLLHST